MQCFLSASIISISLAGAITLAQSTAPQRLPYAAVHEPEFIPASEAAFVHDEDRVIGVVVGKTPKAYPAAILSQHGLVEDRSPSGPIAVTW